MMSVGTLTVTKPVWSQSASTRSASKSSAGTPSASHLTRALMSLDTKMVRTPLACSAAATAMIRLSTMPGSSPAGMATSERAIRTEPPCGFHVTPSSR